MGWIHLQHTRIAVAFSNLLEFFIVFRLKNNYKQWKIPTGLQIRQLYAYVKNEQNPWSWNISIWDVDDIRDYLEKFVKSLRFKEVEVYWLTHFHKSYQHELSIHVLCWPIEVGRENKHKFTRKRLRTQEDWLKLLLNNTTLQNYKCIFLFMSSC